MEKIMEMDIAMFTPGMNITWESLEKDAIGGSETASLSMAKALVKLGHRVYFFCNTTDPGYKPDGVLYFEADKFPTFATLNLHDVTIVQRTPELYGSPTNSRLNILWQHDLAMLRYANTFKATLWNIDKVFVVSNYMKDQYKEVYGMESMDDLFYATRNGIDLNLFRTPVEEKRNKKRIVYAARPERGLDMLLERVMPKIWEKDPEIELALCGYSFTTEAMKPFYDYIQAIVAKNSDRIKWLGGLTKVQLYELLRTSGVYVYPTPSDKMQYFDEVSCLLCSESAAAGLPFVSTNRGALPETMHPEAGVLLDGVPWEDDYVDRFVDATLNFVNNEIDWTKASNAGKKHAQTLSWDDVASDWTKQFAEQIGKNNDNQVRLMRHFIKHSDIVAAQHLLTKMPEEQAAPYKTWIDTNWNLSNGVEWYKEGKIDNLPSDPMIHAGSQTRIQAVANLLMQQPEIKQVLDYGSADGGCVQYYCKYLKDKDFTGVDINENSVKYANDFIGKYELDSSRIRFLQASETTDVISNYVAQKGKFDALTCTDVLEHQPDPSKFIDLLEEYITDEGQVIITVPFGPWEYASFHLPPPREHLWHFDFHDLYDLFKEKKALNIQTITSGVSPETNDPLGYFLVTYTKNGTKTGTIDLERKLVLQRPRQTVSASLIVGAGAEDTLHWCLKPVSTIADEIIIVDCGMSEEAQRILSKYSVKIVSGDNPLEIGFDDARNLSLEHCTMDWILWVDSDEKLLQPEKLNKYLKNNIFNGYSIRQHHFATDTVFPPDLPVRLFRSKPVNGKRIQWYGCLKENTLIETNPSYKKISEIKEGEKVKTADGSYKEVEKIWKYEINDNLLKLEMNKGEFIEITNSHKVLVKKTNRCLHYSKSRYTICREGCSTLPNCKHKFYTDYKFDWIQADAIKENDIVCYPIDNLIEDKTIITLSDYAKNNFKKPSVGWYLKNDYWFTSINANKKIKDELVLDDNLLRLFGYYLSDGWLSNNKKTIAFAFHKDEVAYVNDIKHILESIGLSTNISERKNQKVINIMSNCRPFCEWILAEFGEKSHFKKIPFWIMKLPLDKQKQLLIGLWRGDGHLKKDSSRVSYSSANKFLILQIQKLLYRQGICSSLHQSKFTKCYELDAVIQDKKFLDWDITLPKRKFRLMAWIENGVVHKRVRKISKVPFAGTVYDLKVKDNHSYIANGTIVHNSVHEHPETEINRGPGQSIVLSDVHIAHVGYLIESGRRVKFWRNHPLLIKSNEKYPDRILNKHFIMRDNMLLCTYELQQNRGIVTDNVRKLSEETIGLFREYFLGKGNYLNVDALEYYSQACRFLGLGAEVTFAIAASKTEIPKAELKSYRFANEEDLQKEMEWRVKDSISQFASKWF